MSALAEAAANADGMVRCPDRLRPFLDAGVLTPADVHVATTLAELTGVTDADVLLGVACVVRAPRLGHTCESLDTLVDSTPSADETSTHEVDLQWPQPASWLERIVAAPVCGGPDDGLPLVHVDGLLYLRRQYEQERTFAADLAARLEPFDVTDQPRLTDLLDGLFPGVDEDDPQRLACVRAVARRLSVVTGGPGTGKTWTVTRMLAAMVDQAHSAGRSPRIALAAPTAKAAAQLSDAMATQLEGGLAVPDSVIDAIREAGRGQTIHRLLGRKTASRFWHDRDRPLPHDIVIIDETSMASLSLMARLVEAIRPDAQLVLIGDPDQLPSVDAGSVLADLVELLDDNQIVRLKTTHRFGADSGIGALAAAIRTGDAEQAVAILGSREDLTWLDAAEPTEVDLAPVKGLLVDRGRRLVAAASAGDIATARACMAEAIVLTPHRRGALGVAGWNRRVDRWLSESLDDWNPYVDWQPGRTVLATTNDRALRVFNGDLGVVVATPDGPRLAFNDDPAKLVLPERLDGYELVHAMTIHKSQGSQWRTVIVSLPSGPSRVLSQQLLYTAVTRASANVIVAGTRGSMRDGIHATVHRASGLGVPLHPVGRNET